MKNLLLIFVVTLIFHSEVNGQKMGVFVGIGNSKLSNLSHTQNKNYDNFPQFRFSLGASFFKPIYKKLNLQTEINLSQKGTNFGFFELTYTYLGLAPKLQIKLRNSQEKIFVPYLNFGTYFAYLLSFKKVNTGANGTIPDYFAYNKPKSFDFGINTGVGFDFKISNKLILNIEYQSARGLSNIFKHKSPNNVKVHNIAAFGNVGLKFGF
jgi:Outer membrane protein beta-barrel domain